MNGHKELSNPKEGSEMRSYLKIFAGYLFLFGVFCLSGCATDSGSAFSQIKKQPSVLEEPLLMTQMVDELEVALVVTSQARSIAGSELALTLEKNDWHHVVSTDADRPIDVVCHLDVEGVRLIAQCQMDWNLEVNGKAFIMPSSQGSITLDAKASGTDVAKEVVRLIATQEMDALDAAEKTFSCDKVRKEELLNKGIRNTVSLLDFLCEMT